MQNTQGEDEPPERTRSAGFDSSDQVVDALFAHALESRQLFSSKAVNVADIPHQAARNDLFDHGLAEPFNVHRAARGKVFNSALELGRTAAVDTAQRDLAFLPNDFSAADRAGPGHAKLLFPAG